MMRIVFDINHPGQVHLFKNAARELESGGNRVLMVARDKDVTIRLLQAYGLRYVVGTTRRKGLINLALELLRKTALLVKIAREFRPDIFVSLGSPPAAWASRIMRVPHIAFEDTEHSIEQYLLYAPFTDVIFTPSCFTRNLGKKQRRFNGYHELAYLHPLRFTPDPSILSDLGIQEGDRFFVVRFVSWQATHDRGQRGFGGAGKSALLGLLKQHGKVILSSEANASLMVVESGREVPPCEIHNLLYYATMYIGEGGTMASESAVLGTPSIYINTLPLGYISEQEQRYHLLYVFSECKPAMQRIEELLAIDSLKDTWQVRRERMLADKIDVTGFMVDVITEMAQKRRGRKL